MLVRETCDTRKSQWDGTHVEIFTLHVVQASRLDGSRFVRRALRFAGIHWYWRIVRCCVTFAFEA